MLARCVDSLIPLFADYIWFCVDFPHAPNSYCRPLRIKITSISVAPVLPPNNLSDSGSQTVSDYHCGESLTENSWYPWVKLSHHISMGRKSTSASSEASSKCLRVICRDLLPPPSSSIPETSQQWRQNKMCTDNNSLWRLSRFKT